MTAMLVACESTERKQEQPPWTLVPINDFAKVAGKWEGIMRRTPPMKQDDWVTIVIDESGRYEFVSVRTIGVLSGQGVFSLSEGKISTTSERGSIDGTLYETGTHRMLRTKAKAADGTQYLSDLKPAR